VDEVWTSKFLPELRKFSKNIEAASQFKANKRCHEARSITENPRMTGATVENLFSEAIWHPEICVLSFNSMHKKYTVGI
jgi:hypothetical protein